MILLWVLWGFNFDLKRIMRKRIKKIKLKQRITSVLMLIVLLSVAAGSDVLHLIIPEGSCGCPVLHPVQVTCACGCEAPVDKGDNKDTTQAVAADECPICHFFSTLSLDHCCIDIVPLPLILPNEFISQSASCPQIIRPAVFRSRAPPISPEV